MGQVCKSGTTTGNSYKYRYREKFYLCGGLKFRALRKWRSARSIIKETDMRKNFFAAAIAITVFSVWPLTANADVLQTANDDAVQTERKDTISQVVVTGTRNETFPVRFVPYDRERKFSNIFLWKMTFQPGEEVLLKVFYITGGYLGLGSTLRDPTQPVHYRHEYLHSLDYGIGEMQQYITTVVDQFTTLDQQILEREKKMSYIKDIVQEIGEKVEDISKVLNNLTNQ